MKISEFRISNMDCPTEEALIRKRLSMEAGITSLAFNLMECQLSVTHTLSDEHAILVMLHEVGMKAELVQAAAAGSGAAESPAVSRRMWVLMIVSGSAALGAELLAWSGMDETAPLVIMLAIVSIATGGLGVLKKAWIALKTLTLNINFLMSIATAGAVAIGQWPEAAVVIFLFALAEIIEGLSLERARNAVRNLMAMAPETAMVRQGDGQWQEVVASDVKIGQTVRVRPGERIPLDGVVMLGTSSVNQAPITGESLPIEKSSGDALFAGTVNQNGILEFRVSANAGNTTLARIARSVQEAQGQRAPTQRFVDRFAYYYTPAVVIFAVAVAVVPPIFLGTTFYESIYKALVLLVIACPCALVISTPVTVVSGLAAAARRGILIKGGVHLENGRRLRAVAFDKTGTLTAGRPALTDIIPLAGTEREAMLRLAASLDSHSTHPVATAIVSAFESESSGNRDLLPVDDFEEIPGRGVRGRIGPTRYHVGNHRLIEELRLCSPAIEAVLFQLENEGKTALALIDENEVLCVFGVADTLGVHSAEAIRSLHSLGVTTVMLTGDNQKTADAIAGQVGIDDARGNLLPEDKLRAIDDLLLRHTYVGMVGDGINDAPALAKASIGMAMGAAGTDTAIETADVALMDDDLRKLPEFIMLSRFTSRVLKQNITLALGIKAAFFALALAGKATLWMAVFADMGASLIVVFNGLRLLQSGKQPANQKGTYPE